MENQAVDWNRHVGWLNELHAPSGGRLPFTLLDLDNDGFYTVEDHTTLSPDNTAPACCIRPQTGGYIGAPAVLVNGATEGQFISETAGTVAQWVKNPGPRVCGPSVLGARVIAVMPWLRWS